MKKPVLTTSDEKEMQFIPENRIFEVGEENDTMTAAFVHIINVKGFDVFVDQELFDDHTQTTMKAV